MGQQMTEGIYYRFQVPRNMRRSHPLRPLRVISPDRGNQPPWAQGEPLEYAKFGNVFFESGYVFHAEAWYTGHRKKRSVPMSILSQLNSPATRHLRRHCRVCRAHLHRVPHPRVEGRACAWHGPGQIQSAWSSQRDVFPALPSVGILLGVIACPAVSARHGRGFACPVIDAPNYERRWRRRRPSRWHESCLLPK